MRKEGPSLTALLKGVLVMNRYGFLLINLFIISIFFGRSVEAAETQTVCWNAPVPNGWLVSDIDVNTSTSTCGSWGGPGDPDYNAKIIVRYDNLPVGASLSVCSNIVPAGWTLTGTSGGLPNCWIPSSINPSYTYNISHTSCVNQSQSTCYPPPPPIPAGTISVSASSVVVPYEQSSGSVNVSWSVQNTSGSCVWEINTVNGTAGQKSLWACAGTSGSGTWPYVPKGGSTQFILTATSSTSSATLASKTVVGVAGAQSTLKPVSSYNLVQTGATSWDVLIPATASPTTGPVAFTWSAPGYSSVDLIGQVNSGGWGAPFQIAASGTSGYDVPLGATYENRMIPHGATSPILAAMSLRGVAAPAPTFSISSTHVIVPIGSSEGSFTFNWSAPGYEHLDITGQTNGGAWGAPFGIPATGSTGMNISVGTTYNFRFYPPGDTVHILGTLSTTASH